MTHKNNANEKWGKSENYKDIENNRANLFPSFKPYIIYLLFN